MTDKPATPDELRAQLLDGLRKEFGAFHTDVAPTMGADAAYMTSMLFHAVVGAGKDHGLTDEQLMQVVMGVFFPGFDMIVGIPDKSDYEEQTHTVKGSLN